VQTDSLGVARIKWTLGHTAGDHTLGVHLDGVSKTLKLTARALPAAVANLSFDDVPDDRASRTKARHLVAVVSDAFGNPIPDAHVTFSTKSGSVAPARAVSDAKGRIKLAWTPSAGTSEQMLTGRVQGTDVRSVYSAPAPTSAPHPTAKTASSKAVPSRPSRK
jgi:hypothetical protein